MKIIKKKKIDGKIKYVINIKKKKRKHLLMYVQVVLTSVVVRWSEYDSSSEGGKGLPLLCEVIGSSL